MNSSQNQVYNVLNRTSTIIAIFIFALSLLSASCSQSIAVVPLVPASDDAIPTGRSLSLDLIDSHQNLRFHAGSNDDFLFLSIEVLAKPESGRYSNSVFGIWLDVTGGKNKNLGIQFSGRNIPHPLVTSEYVTPLKWGGFKNILAKEDLKNLEDLKNSMKSKIVFFNPDGRTMQLIDPDGSEGFVFSREVTRDGLIFHITVPLNADGVRKFGLKNFNSSTLSLGFEILPDIRMRKRQSQPQRTAVPGMQSGGMQRRDMQNRSEMMTYQGSDIHWLTLKFEG